MWLNACVCVKSDMCTHCCCVIGGVKSFSQHNFYYIKTIYNYIVVDYHSSISCPFPRLPHIYVKLSHQGPQGLILTQSTPAFTMIPVRTIHLIWHKYDISSKQNVNVSTTVIFISRPIKSYCSLMSTFAYSCWQWFITTLRPMFWNSSKFTWYSTHC